MPAMNASTSVRADRQVGKAGLPKINYMPAIVATLAAAALLLLIMVLLAFFGILNTATQFSGASQNEPGRSSAGGILCGVLTLFALVGVVYFFLALVKGVRDVGSAPYFTRGSVIVKPGEQVRNAKNWLLIEPEYVGADLQAASVISDEQRAVSADRSTILNPRFAPSGDKRGQGIDKDGLRRDIEKTGNTSSGYLNPSRISANQPTPELETQLAPRPKAVFRIDFANKAGFDTGEEVIVAHSRYLQHVYYIARLRGGEWEILHQ